MALEAKIEELTSAVIALTMAITTPRVIQDVLKVPLDEIKRLERKEVIVPLTKVIELEAPNAMRIEGHPVAICNAIRDATPIESEEKPALTYNDVKAATLKLSQNNGRELAVDVLPRSREKGAQRVSDGQLTDYA